MNEKTEWQQGGNNSDIGELIYLKCVWNISRAIERIKWIMQLMAL